MWLQTLASVGMAVGPPLVYADQFVSILRRKDSSGFSIDVCGVLIIANITRMFFWLGERFELALLIQSVLMTLAQLALLYVCLRFKHDDPHAPLSETSLTLKVARSTMLNRPLQFWQWPAYGAYIEFIAAYIIFLAVLFLALGRFETFVAILGFVALGLESTLPLPQLYINWQRKSLAGFRTTVLLGWIFGDAFKTLYFFLQKGPISIQFKICGIFQLSVDCLIAYQAWLYRENTRREYADGQDEGLLRDPLGSTA
ncbi:uncharacterized protein L969DRAFT_47740 [Mixia osmundae IAM 14324]|uniref:PQ-loop repeat-containing protein 1 n=1 Tax=Mixia osmundae (strain CBS 9802 / IAM 14324 / JCM 22182 / KY 12970) TaxID=764103 RepID=G7E932_MIXOS|nr:uncharacterized protein L969DRAFT_47740 [Mixia osmundae IAM 14324]KEI40286.1 hypothetical protein L969DRAFT_47740 [Mixia osmundae IAM 14324]GAA99650.1 hypothetical protein E5Q_06353 [Mixia osmundae IAM 14324]